MNFLQSSPIRNTSNDSNKDDELDKPKRFNTQSQKQQQQINETADECLSPFLDSSLVDAVSSMCANQGKNDFNNLPTNTDLSML